jgi:hypothetical protein
VRPAANLRLPAADLSLATPAGGGDAELAGQHKAEEVIKTFLGYTKVEDVLDHVLNRERVAPGIRKFYAEHPLEPTPFTELVLDSGAHVAESNIQAFLFRVRSQDRAEGFPICVEETPQGYKIEWEAFIQCRERSAAKFWKDSQAESSSLYVILKRSHYFGDDMQNLDDFDCFRINSPNPDEQPAYAFARKDSAFSRKFRNQIAWDANYFAVATFTHVKNTPGGVHHEILDIVRFNWRGAGK